VSERFGAIRHCWVVDIFDCTLPDAVQHDVDVMVEDTMGVENDMQAILWDPQGAHQPYKNLNDFIKLHAAEGDEVLLRWSY
jgi:hypothetical protein